MLLFHHHQCVSTTMVFQKSVSNYLIRTAGKVWEQMGSFCTSLCTLSLQRWTNSLLLCPCSQLNTQMRDLTQPQWKCRLVNLHSMPDLTILLRSSYCWPYNDNIRWSALLDKEYNPNGSISWGRSVVVCQPLWSTAQNQLVHRCGAYHCLVMPVRKWGGGGGLQRQLQQWAGAMCVKERGLGVELQGLSLV